MRTLRLAFRTLLKTPLVTSVVVVSLALGIGANAAIFSLFDELLLAPLPVPHPEQLVLFGGNSPSPGSHQTTLAGGNARWVFSYPMFRDLASHPGPFTGIAGHEDFSANVAFSGNTVSASAEFVSGSYFPVLEVKAAIGRLIGPADDQVIGADAVVVLSHDYWTSQFGADPSIVGQMVSINGRTMRVIGVAQAGFDGTTTGYKPQLFVPLTTRGLLMPGFDSYVGRDSYWLYVFARRAAGVTLDQAAARENVLYHSIINNVEVPLQHGVSATVMARFRAKKLELSDGRRGSSDLHQQTQTPMLLLVAITLFVLAIACANIANLLLARAANRSTEMAVRLSLGATRRRLLVQLLTESLLLAALGGIAGLGVAWATLNGMVALLPASVASPLSFTLSSHAIVLAALLSTITGLAFGLFPALQSTRPDLVSALRNGSGKTSATRTAKRVRASLVTVQVALSMALLFAAGLFIRSLRNVGRVDLGIDVNQVVTFRVSPWLNGYSGAHTQQILADIERHLATIPGINAVAAARVPLIAGNNNDDNVSVQGFPATPDVDRDAYTNRVGAGFFRAIREPIIAGREFTTADALGSTRVAIVNEAFVKKFHLGAGAVGKMMGEGDSLTHVIVGVAKDSKYSGVRQEDRPVYFLPYMQDTTVGSLSFYVRSSLPSAGLMSQIRSIVSHIDRTLPITGLETMPQQIRDNVYLDHMITTLSAGFAALATLLAALGLYGVLAYSVAQRTKEIGVRMALGADSRSIVGMVLRSVGLMTIVGVSIGVAAAYGIGRGAQSLLFGVQGSDPVVMLSAAAVLGLVALAAGSIPAWRAARIDPVKALRYE